MYKDLFLINFQPRVNKNSLNLAILTLQFNDVTLKTIKFLIKFGILTNKFNTHFTIWLVENVFVLTVFPAALAAREKGRINLIA